MEREVEKAAARLHRTTWDSRVLPSRQDVCTIMEEIERATAEYCEPMSALTAAERGERLFDRISTLTPTQETNSHE